MKPLLTHIITGRNDNYLGNFKYRLELAVNYTCNAIAASGNLEDYRLTIVDWGSDTPLRYALNLNEVAQQCTTFWEVSRDLIQKNKPSDSALDIPTALNVAIRRAEADMILVTPADVFMPFMAVKSLFNLLRGQVPYQVDVKNTYIAIERLVIPWQAAERLQHDNMERYITITSSALTNYPFIRGTGNGEGATLISKSLLERLRGYDESYVYYGRNDIEFARRVRQTCLQIRPQSIGLYCYDLFQRNLQRRTLRINHDRVSESAVTNDEHWGLAQVDIPRRPAVATEIDNAPQAVQPYDVADDLGAMEHRPLRKIEAALTSLLGYPQFGRKAPQLAAVLLFFAKFCGVSPKRNRVRGFLLRRAAQTALHQWLNALPGRGDKQWYITEWFGKADTLNSYFAYLLNKDLHQLRFTSRFVTDKKEWDLKSLSLWLALVATVGRMRPARFFYAPSRNNLIAQYIALIDPTSEIVAYDHWQGVPEGTLLDVSAALFDAKYQGYFHPLSGSMNTAFARLREMQYVGEQFECFLLDLQFFKPILHNLREQLSPFFAPACAVICHGNDADRNFFESELGKEGFTVVGRLPDLTVLSRCK